MLMTVLKGDLAIEQSRTLIRFFKGMKDYIIENKQLMHSQADYYTLAERVENNSKNIESIKGKMITRADLSDFMKLFDRSIQAEPAAKMLASVSRQLQGLWIQTPIEKQYVHC